MLTPDLFAPPAQDLSDDPIAIIQRCAKGEFNADAQAYFADVMARLHSPLTTSIERAFSLTSGERMRDRNRALHAAAMILSPGGSKWHKACVLAAAIERYQTRTLPMLRAGLVAPTDFDLLLQRAHCFGHLVPTTPEGLLAPLKMTDET